MVISLEHWMIYYPKVQQFANSYNCYGNKMVQQKKIKLNSLFEIEKEQRTKSKDFLSIQ
jgi:hypothetical protein